MQHDELGGRGIYSHNEIDQRIAARIETGAVQITPVANTPTSGAITFATPFEAAPRMFVTYTGQYPGTVVTGVSVDGITTTGANVWVTRTNTVATWVYWMAVGT